MKRLDRGKREIRRKCFPCSLPGLTNYLETRTWEMFKVAFEERFCCFVTVEKVVENFKLFFSHRFIEPLLLR